jgi:hypothetical protein
MTRNQLHIMVQTSPQAWVNRIQMSDVSIIPREGEWVEMPEGAPEKKPGMGHYKVYRVDHAYNIKGDGVAVIMVYCRAEQRSE